jgi:hypothetical protein
MKFKLTTLFLLWNNLSQKPQHFSHLRFSVYLPCLLTYRLTVPPSLSHFTLGLAETYKLQTEEALNTQNVFSFPF